MSEVNEVITPERLRRNISDDPGGNKLRNKINKIDPNEPDAPSITFHTTVRDVYLSAPVGWFLWLEGSWESLYVGADKPEWLKEGDRVKITIQKESEDG